jgi:N-acetylneuraminic acid mutarotase
MDSVKFVAARSAMGSNWAGPRLAVVEDGFVFMGVEKMKKIKWIALSAVVLVTTIFGFQNCGKLKKSTDSSQSSTSSPSSTPGLQAGDPTASDIQNVSVVPGETATILIVLNALPTEDLVYTYSTADDTATAGTHYIGVQGGNGGIFAGSPSAQLTIDTTDTAGVSYFGKDFKVNVSFPSKPALSKTVVVNFSAAPTGVALTDKWALFPTSSFAPVGRFFHTAVWTGSHMIVMGGYASGSVIQNNGKSYDPSANIWIDINMTGGPGPRGNHSAVWTGTKMIVWGGRSDAAVAVTNTGMSYDPLTNLWAPISTTNAPSARYGHVAVWTGTKMIVWGGYNGSAYLSDGAIYDPAADTWTAMNAAAPPAARSNAIAAWAGNKMIVWGGSNGTSFADGKAFDPAANTWTVINPTGAPTARGFLKGVSTGTKMIVWGGYGSATTEVANGEIYDPVKDTWAPMSPTGAPSARYGSSGVWTGSSAFYWGGVNSTAGGVVYGDGGIYY